MTQTQQLSQLLVQQLKMQEETTENVFLRLIPLDEAFQTQMSRYEAQWKQKADKRNWWK